jgi:branched-chain amino acid transport system ATP-binding protein
MLQINRLTKRFGQSTVLDELNLEINDGEIVGIVGENGAGKTTLFNIISGFESFDSGEINLDNVSIQDLQPNVRSHLGLARTFQSDGLFPNLTVYENLELAFKLPKEASATDKLLHFMRFGKQEAKENAINQALTKVKMHDQKHKLAKDLSGGQLKLVEIARTLMFDWKVLILDEPLAGVHHDLKEELSKHVLSLKSEKRSIVIIEHDLDFLKSVSDRILILTNGQLKTNLN